MQNLMFILMMPPFLDNPLDRGPFGSLIMFLIIFSIPLSWVIPYIVRKYRNKQGHQRRISATAKTQIEQLKDLADLKEKGILTEEEFLAQKNKILGKEG
jgi:hypothetical protein